jgi:hypothetical protein
MPPITRCPASRPRPYGRRGPRPGFTFNVKAFRLFTHHPTPVAALPVDLRPAAEKTGKDRVYFKDVGPAWPMRRGAGFRPRWRRCARRASWA